MKLKTLWLTISTLALLTVSGFAQVGRIEGDVLKKGSTEGIPGAEVEIVRTDIKGTYPVKSDKKGHFLHAGVPYVGTYTIIVSAPGFAPTFLTGIRPAQGEGLKIEMDAGDGRKLTIDEVKKFGGGGGPAAPGAAAAKQPSAAEIKKQQEEYEKAKAANEKQKADFDNMKKFFESGIAKQNTKDYSGAIADFNEAGKLDPEQKAIWANLALALYNRGVGAFNESLKGDLSKRDVAKQDFNDSVAAVAKAMPLLEKDLADPAKAAAAKKDKFTYIKIKADSEALLAKRLGVTEAVEAAVKDYAEVAELAETPADKVKFQLAGASVLFESGKAEESVAAYNKILETNPDNLDAIYQLGLSFASVAKFQESADTFQKFLDRAPESDARVVEVKAVLKDLIVGNNLKAPKADDKKKPAPAKKKG